MADFCGEEFFELVQPVKQDIRILCKECGSEIYGCLNSIKRITDAYGKILCPLCREHTPKLIVVQLCEIQDRLAKIYKIQIELEQEAAALCTRYRELCNGRNE